MTALEIEQRYNQIHSRQKKLIQAFLRSKDEKYKYRTHLLIALMDDIKEYLDRELWRMYQKDLKRLKREKAEKENSITIDYCAFDYKTLDAIKGALVATQQWEQAAKVRTMMHIIKDINNIVNEVNQNK